MLAAGPWWLQWLWTLLSCMGLTAPSNRLTNVQSLMDCDLPKAKQMLQSFTDYLPASPTALRGEHSAVAQELALAQSYLELLQARMEDRLRFSITADSVHGARQQP